MPWPPPGPRGRQAWPHVGLLARKALGGARLDLDLGIGLGDGRQAILAALELLGQAHAVGKVGRVGLLGKRLQLLDLAFELCLDGLGVAIGQRTVTAGVGVDPGAAQADRAEAAELVLAGDHLEHLEKRPLEGLGEASSEAREGIVVGMAVGGDEAKRRVVVGRPLDLAAGTAAGGVSIDQQRQQGGGGVGKAGYPARRRRVPAH